MKLESPTQVCASRRRDIERLLTWLRQAIRQQARHAKQEGGPNWRDAGDLGVVRERLMDALCLLAQQEEADVKKALADAAAGRKTHGKE